MGNRVKYVDIAKGIGMLSVLVGHTYAGIPWTITNSFHMPLFFLLSGYFFRQRERKEILAKGVERLILPYIFTCIMFIVYFTVKDLINGAGNNGNEWIYGMRYTGVATMVNCYVPSLMSVITPICGSLVIVWLSKLIENIPKASDFFAFLGKTSIAILCFHIFELHTGILSTIADSYSPFGMNGLDTVFILRVFWGIMWAYITLKNGLLRRVFNLKLEGER